MADTLVIVESPAKAKTIGKFLGSHYRVIASEGHVRDMPKSALGVDINNGFTPRYITLRGKGPILDKLRKAARTVKHVYLATDPDREGEAISWHLAFILGIDPASKCRVTFNEITSAAVKKAIHEPRAIDMDLVNAQQARRILDRLIGYQVSEIMWDKIAGNLSAGRVQSAAARLICDREQEISAFCPEEYWTVSAELSTQGSENAFHASLFAVNGEKQRLSCEADAMSAVEGSNGSFTVREITRSEKTRHAAPPFTTSTLQQEASRKLNFTTRKTMSIAQQLYEGISLGDAGTQGLISYIRTDSVRIAEEAQQAALAVIKERYGDAYVPETANVYRGRSNAQDAHEAIRPTDVSRRPESVKEFLTRDQLKLYKLIYDRFFSSQMSDAKLDTVSAVINAGSCSYRASGSTVTFRGFMLVYTEGRDEGQEDSSQQDGLLPQLEAGMSLNVLSAPKAEQHFTQPPARYTEASLVRTLEEQGIGRPSTYAPIISTIIDHGYVVKDKKQLRPTELGMLVNTWMGNNFPNIVDIGFTAGMEKQLDEVGDGSLNYPGMLNRFYGGFEDSLSKAKEQQPIVVPDRVSDVQCPECGAMLIYKLSKYGEFLACPNYPACHHTESIVEKAGVKCPLCGGDVILRKGKKGKTFYGCSNYPTCNFLTWDKPSGELCPKCGKPLVVKNTKNGTMVLCQDRECGYRLLKEDLEEHE